MADYDWFDRNPTPDEIRANKYRPLGFHPVWGRPYSNGLLYFLCKRGCGTVVHDPEVHMKNVCKTFNPTIGE